MCQIHDKKRIFKQRDIRAKIKSTFVSQLGNSEYVKDWNKCTFIPGRGRDIAYSIRFWPVGHKRAVWEYLKFLLYAVWKLKIEITKAFCYPLTDRQDMAPTYIINIHDSTLNNCIFGSNNEQCINASRQHPQSYSLEHLRHGKSSSAHFSVMCLNYFVHMYRLWYWTSNQIARAGTLASRIMMVTITAEHSCGIMKTNVLSLRIISICLVILYPRAVTH